MRALRLALRRLAHERAFALIAILTLAIGIGANTAIFSLVDGVLLRPLAFRQPQQLVVLDQSIPQFTSKYPFFPVDAASYYQWRQHSKLLDGLAQFTATSWVLTGAGHPLQVYGADISSSLFPLLGVPMALGRNFTPEEDAPGKNHEVILSNTFWRSALHADPGVIGRTLDLDGEPNVVVGVLPASLDFPHGAELGPFVGGGADHPMQLFRPSGLDLAAAPPLNNFNLFVIARLKPGVTAARLRAELDVIESNFLTARHAPITTVNAVVTPLRDEIVGNHGFGLWLLLAAVGAILLIVCLNLANLLLVRVHGRGHELAIRVALGAGRARLIRETVLEGVVLALLGGAVGVIAAWAALRWLVHAAPAGIPRLSEVSLNPLVLLFAVVLALICGVLFSLWPALRSAKSDPQSALRSGGRSASDAGQRLRVRSWLVGAQAALAALLLIVAGLLVASYMQLLGVNKGFQANHVLETGIVWPTNNGVQHLRFYHTILDKLSALPGVQRAGLIDVLPTQGTNNNSLLSYPNDPRPLVDQPLSEYSYISAAYFAAAGIPLLRGRTFTDAEMAAGARESASQSAVPPNSSAPAPALAPLPAVVSATTAAKIWPGKDPLGQQFQRGGPGNGPLFHVVGVAADVRTDGLEKTPGLQVYLPYTWRVPDGIAVMLRTAAPLAALAPRIRAAVWSTQPAAAVTGVETMDEVVASSVAARRFQMLLIIAFAACALLLAALGIYGVIAYSIERRTGEISIRMTMGASPADLVAMVMRQGLTPVLLGLLAGVLLALASGKLLASLLFGVRATDPAVIASVVVLLLAAASLACALPARRATRINPVSILRS